MATDNPGADIAAVVHALCTAFPEVAPSTWHGMPDYRVGGRAFAVLALNHHGDRRAALWLRAPEGGQGLHVALDPAAYFVPPYVGRQGWLGVLLDGARDWSAIAQRVAEAYDHVGGPGRASARGPVPEVAPPAGADADAFEDPFASARALEVLAPLGEWAETLPEVSRGERFGQPTWLVGKKGFLIASTRNGRLTLLFRVGGELQVSLTLDSRFAIPRYMGHHGWVSLDVHEHFDLSEAEELALMSYRHYALKRMLKQLDARDQDSR